MNTWEYFYVRHCVQIAEKWEKKLGWSVWDSCFDYLHGCEQIDYVVLSLVNS